MIHATPTSISTAWTDFHPGAIDAAMVAIIGRRSRVLADVEMICVGLSAPRLSHFGISTHQLSAMRLIAARRPRHDARRAGDAPGAPASWWMVRSWAIGNAPTALIEIVRLIRRTGTTRIVIGMPVGFVSARVPRI